MNISETKTVPVDWDAVRETERDECNAYDHDWVYLPGTYGPSYCSRCCEDFETLMMEEVKND